MKVNIFSLAIVATSMFMVSCTNDDTTVLNNDRTVRFTSGATATPGGTRVAIDADGNSLWDAGDPVGIYMVGRGTTDVVDGNANMKYTAARAGASTAFNAADASIYYPLNEAAPVDFIAYHPYSAAVTDFAYPIDLSRQTPQTAIDLMTARADKGGEGYTKADGSANTVVDLTFSHRLAKLVMNVTKDASVPGTIIGVEITGMNTRAKFDLKGTDGLTDAGTPASIFPCTVTAGEKYEAILLPVDALTAGHTVTFTTDANEVYTWAISKDIAKLEAGKIYTYDVNVTKYAVTASGSINSWAVGSTGTGTAE